MRNSRFLIALLTIFAILLLGCSSPQEPIVTETPIVVTIAPTATSIPPTATSVPPTATAAPTETPLPSPTLTATSLPLPVPFGAELAPGEWREVTEAELALVRDGVIGRAEQMQDLRHARVMRTPAGQLIMIGLPNSLQFIDQEILYWNFLTGEKANHGTNPDAFDEFLALKTNGQYQTDGRLRIHMISLHPGGEDFDFDRSTPGGSIIDPVIDEELLPNTDVSIDTYGPEQARIYFQPSAVGPELHDFATSLLINGGLIATTYARPIPSESRIRAMLDFGNNPPRWDNYAGAHGVIFHIHYAP